MLTAVKEKSLRHDLQRLLRRFQSVVNIPPLNKEAMELWLTGFFKGYVEDAYLQASLTGEVWQEFAAAWCHWEPQVEVPFDMVSKYAERAVRDFYVDGDWRLGRRQNTGKIGGSARLAQDSANASHIQEAFLRAVLNPEAVGRFIQEYAGGSQLAKFQQARVTRARYEENKGFIGDDLAPLGKRKRK